MHADNYTRGASLLESMVEKNTVILHHLWDKFAEERGYGRFLQDDKITAQDVVKSYRPALPDGLCDMHVLWVQDTTEISFGLNSSKKGLGKVGNGGSEGFFSHPVIGINAADGGCLGLGAAEIHKRQEYIPTASDIEAARCTLEKSALKKALKTGETAKPVNETLVLREARERHQPNYLLNPKTATVG